MGLFISYSSHDSVALSSLLSALRQAREEVWFDDELSGGEAWWGKILERIRECDVFIFALSTNSLKSKACLAELHYAQELHKPIIPVQIGPVSSMRVTPLADVEAIDYQSPTVESGIRLTVAVREARQRLTPLPSPLPDEPPVPFAYLMRLAMSLDGPQLDARTQATLLAELKASLEEDGSDATARRDIVQLLCALRDRPDVTYRTRSEVEYVLAALGVGGAAPAPAGRATSPGSPISAGAAPIQSPPTPSVPLPTGPAPGFTSPPGRGGKRPLILGGAVVIAVAVIAAVLVAVNRSNTTTTPPAPAPRTFSPAELNSTLLDTQEVDEILGATLEASKVYTAMQDTQSASDPDCLGVIYAAQKQAYEGSGWSALGDQTFTRSSPDDPNEKLLYAEQVAVSFPSDERAGAFLENSTNNWKNCADKVVSVTSKRSDSTWAIADMRSTGGTIATVATEEGATGWACQRALTAYSNLVFESTACSRDDTGDAATRIVEQMVAKAQG